MRKTLIALILLLAALPAQAQLRVFACEPEWAALTEELAGDRAEVFTATTAEQDPHYIQARPSLIAQLRRADLAVCTGAELEAGWLPMLQRRANNPKVAAGAPGHFEAAAQVPLLDRPAQLDRSAGDVHASGNPHVHLDPHRIARIAERLTARLVELDPAQAEHYRARSADFQQRWRSAIERWEAQAKPLKGLPVVEQHQNWRYLQEWLGLELVAALEPKPGVPPTSSHLAEVLAQVKARQVPVALYTAYQDPRPAQWLAARSNVEPVELPYTVGGSAQAQDLFSLYEDTLRRLLEAAR
jgi:zinc/manganese transport system substrate-binding protein